MRPATRKLLGIVVVADLALVAVVALVWWLRQPPEELAALIAANPGWTVATERDWVVLTENATQRRIVISPEQIGPYALRSVPCAEIDAARPAWFRVPGDSSETEPLACVHVRGADQDAYVMNFLTALEIPQVWDEHFGPLADAGKAGYWGGHSMGGRRGSKPLDREAIGAAARPPLPGASGPRRAGTLSYGIDPEPGSGQRQTHLHATHVGDETLVVATFSKPPP